MKMLQPYNIKSLELKNRVVMAPMCMYSADATGVANQFHFTHYLTRAVGGVGLIIVEATGVTPEGRISENDLGLWNHEQMLGLKQLVTEVHNNNTKIAIQLAHAGRKHIGTSQHPVAPSSIAYDDQSRVPIALEAASIKAIVDSFVKAAVLADEAGFDSVEIHGAHGYLIHEFLSPLTNKRTDEYGGSIENRARFLLEIAKGIRHVLPPEKPVLLRVSASDHQSGGITITDMVKIISLVKEYIDIVHVSSGGLVNVPIDVYPGYQVEFATKIKQSCDIDTIAVGKITQIEMIEEILGNQRADLVALGRELLRNPYFVLNAYQSKELQDEKIPLPYRRGF